MSKQSDLEAAAATVRSFIDQEIPTVGQWNVNVDVLEGALMLLGGFFTDLETLIAALTALFQADHDPVTGKNPAPVEWVPEAAAPTFLTTNQFSLPNDRTADYRVHDRLRIHQGTGGATLVIVAVTGVAYSSLTLRTTITVAASGNAAPLVSSLASVDRAFVHDSIRRIGGFDLIDNAVDNPRILATDVVTGPKILNGAVTATKIADGEVIAGKLGPAAVVAANIAAGQVGNSQLANGAVTSNKIGNAQITSAKFDAGAVLDFAIGNLQVKRHHIADQNIDPQHLSLNCVTETRIADGAVAMAKIRDGAVTPAKRAPLNYRNNASAQVIAATYEQRGWTYVTRTGGQNAFAQAIVFPVPFATILGVQLTVLGMKSGTNPPVPVSISDSDPNKTPTGSGTSGLSNFPLAMVQGGSLSNAGFTVLITANSTANTWADGEHVLFCWTATGT